MLFGYISSARSISRALALLCLLPVEALARPLPPLHEFLAGARSASVDNREAALAAVVRREEALVALGRLLPAASVRGQYTHNQYEVSFNLPSGTLPPGLSFPSGPIQPLNQWDGYFQLDQPIVDLGAWARLRSARESARAARQSARATTLDVDKQVARNYYQLVGAAALRASAERTLAAAKANHELTRERRAGGVATELDAALKLSISCWTLASMVPARGMPAPIDERPVAGSSIRSRSSSGASLDIVPSQATLTLSSRTSSVFFMRASSRS
jgi:hypothetical protein